MVYIILDNKMNQLITRLTWGIISLQGLLLLVDPQARNHIYNTFSSFNSVSLPFIQSFSENLRYIVSFILIPSVLYPRFFIVPKFATLVAYVFFICLHSNLIFYNKPSDVKCLLFQLLILGKALYLLVDDMLASEDEERKKTLTIKRSNSNLAKQQQKPKQVGQKQQAQKETKQDKLGKGKGIKKQK